MGASGYMYMYIFTTDRFHDFTPPNGKLSKLSKFDKNRQNWGPHSFFGVLWGGVKIVKSVCGEDIHVHVYPEEPIRSLFVFP